MNWNDILRLYSDEVIFSMCTTHNIAGFERGVSTNSRTRAIDLLRKQLGKPEVVRTALQQMGVV